MDDLVSAGANDVDKKPTVADVKPEQTKAEAGPEEKKARKEKDKSTKLVYSDNETSPEEKMAKLSRYAYVPSG